MLTSSASIEICQLELGVQLWETAPSFVLMRSVIQCVALHFVTLHLFSTRRGPGCRDSGYKGVHLFSCPALSSRAEHRQRHVARPCYFLWLSFTHLFLQDLISDAVAPLYVYLCHFLNPPPPPPKMTRLLNSCQLLWTCLSLVWGVLIGEAK